MYAILKRASWGTFMRSNMNFGPVGQEKMLKEKVYGRRTHDGRRTKTDHNEPLTPLVKFSGSAHGEADEFSHTLY